MSALPMSIRSTLLRRFPGRTTLLIGVAIFVTILLIAVLAPLIAPYDPVSQDGSARLNPPSWAHPFGTDNYGRDMLSRVLWGARVDVQMAILGVIFPFTIGTTIGTVAGYFGGAVDAFFMRILDVVIAFPYLVLIIAIIAILGPGLQSFYIALALVGWVSYARLIRAQILVLKGQDFIIAARSLGYSHRRIMFRHLLPNALVSSIVFSMSDMVLVLLGGASISFLGLGVQPPTAEWGIMIAEGQSFINRAWWMPTFPGLAILVLSFGFSMIADGLGEWLGVNE